MTIVFALAGSLLLSLTVIPVLASYLLKTAAHQDPWLPRKLLAKDSTLKVGDLVYVKVLDCAGQAVPRTMQKRSAAAPYRDQARLPVAQCPLPPAVYTAACHA